MRWFGTIVVLVAVAVAPVPAARAQPEAVPTRRPDRQPEGRSPGRADGVEARAAEGRGPDGRRDAAPPAVAAMRQAFSELADADAAVREAARLKLMGMRPEDLGAFRGLVQESLPLMPSQAAVLRHIVTHVFLAGQKYDTTETEGFLGVRMQETSVRLPAGDGADQQFAPAVGVVIVERMPGFVGSKMLVDGDVILGVVERPDVRTLGMYEFQMVVKSVTPGTTIHFQVMRQGQVMRVPVAPDPRPFEADGLMQDLLYRRQRQAEEFWEKSFANVLKEGVG